MIDIGPAMNILFLMAVIIAILVIQWGIYAILREGYKYKSFPMLFTGVFFALIELAWLIDYFWFGVSF